MTYKYEWFSTAGDGYSILCDGNECAPEDICNNLNNMVGMVDLAELRKAVANYMCSEGCGCCRGDNHEENKKALAELLNVPPYFDGSGYDFYQFAGKK